RIGEIHLVRVAADDHPAAHSEAGQKHFHLQRRGVLRFVEDDEGVVERATAHEGERRDLDLARGNPALDLLGRQHVVERIVERAEIGIDLLLHIAGEEAEPLAGLDRRAREDQSIDASADQLRHRLRDREIGLTGSRGAEAEDHLVAGERFHIRSLHRRARDDRLLACADHHARRGGDFFLDDPVEIRLGGHAEHRLNRFGVDVMAVVEPVVETNQHVASPGRGIGVTLDLHAVAARSNVDSKPLLDGDQVTVVVAEQRAEQVRLLELDLEARAVGNRGKVAARHQAAAFWRTAPVMLFGPAATRVTSIISPGRAPVSTWTDWSHGERPIIWPECLPLRSIRTCVSTPTFALLNATWWALIRACSRCSRSSMISGGIWSSIVAAGVPGRALYLNE